MSQLLGGPAVQADPRRRGAARCGWAPFPRLYRPPYGATTTPRWPCRRTEDADDAVGGGHQRTGCAPGHARIIRSACRGARPGAVILMHDGGGDRSETVAALPRSSTRCGRTLLVRDGAAAAAAGPTAARQQLLTSSESSARLGRWHGPGRAAGTGPLARPHGGEILAPPIVQRVPGGDHGRAGQRPDRRPTRPRRPPRSWMRVGERAARGPAKFQPRRPEPASRARQGDGPGRARDEEARRAMEDALPKLSAAAGQEVTGEVGDSEPLMAIQDALDPAALRRDHHLDAAAWDLALAAPRPDQQGARAGPPVTHVLGPSDGQPAAAGHEEAAAGVQAGAVKLATFTAPGLEEPRAGVFRDDVVNALEADQRVVDVLAGQRPRFAGCLGRSTGWRCSPRSPTRPRSTRSA